jgi:hypothetical protein
LINKSTIKNFNYNKIMKKLLLTTALIGSTLVAGNAIAQTTVSGNLNIAYKASEAKGAAGASTNNSGNGFGNEQQINIQNKGKLNNGMDYAAGFSIENDGGQTTTLFNENVYIDFISGNTTVTIGMDHIQNIDRMVSTFISGIEAVDMATGVNGTSIFAANAVGANPAQAYHVGVTQTVPGFGKFSALYAPSNDATQGTGVSDKGFVETDSESAYEVGFTGDLGVKGLTTHAFYNKQSATAGSKAVTAANVNDLKGKNIGMAYNFGTISAGYDYKKNGAQTVNADTTQHSYGIAYTVTPNLTLVGNYTKAEKQGTAVDAKSKQVSIGYNLGPVVLVGSYADQSDITGVNGVDAKIIYLTARTFF